MNAPILSILYFLLASLLGAFGQFLYKSGVESSTNGILSYLINIRILAGVACYIAVMLLFVAAYKKGGSLTVLYPIYATTFIWSAVLAFFIYQVPIKPINIAGMASVILGMYMMGR